MCVFENGNRLHTLTHLNTLTEEYRAYVVCPFVSQFASVFVRRQSSLCVFHSVGLVDWAAVCMRLHNQNSEKCDRNGVAIAVVVTSVCGMCAKSMCTASVFIETADRSHRCIKIYKSCVIYRHTCHVYILFEECSTQIPLRSVPIIIYIYLHIYSFRRYLKSLVTPYAYISCVCGITPFRAMIAFL